MNVKFQILVLMICNVTACKSEVRTIVIEITHDEDFTVHDFEEQGDVIRLGNYDLQDWPVSNIQPAVADDNETTDVFATNGIVAPVPDANVTSVYNATESEDHNETNTPDRNNLTKQSVQENHLMRKATVDLATNSGQPRAQTSLNKFSNTNNRKQKTKTNVTASLETRKRLFDVLRRFTAYTKEKKGNGEVMSSDEGNGDVMSSDDAFRSLISRRRVNSLWPVLMRRRRQVNIDLQDIANEDWVITTPSPLKNFTHLQDEQDDFQVISDEDRRNAEKAKYKATLLYVGTTLLSVATFSAIAFCFLRDPKGCIVAFGTGCPCLLVVMPCLKRCFDKYLNIGRMVKENLNTYLPGVIVNEDGTIERYEPTPEEMECVADIIDEIMD